MKKIKLLVPLLGLSTITAAILPTVSCNKSQKSDYETYKVTLDEDLAEFVKINVSSIDEGCDLFAILTITQGTKIFADSPIVTSGDHIIPADEIIFERAPDYSTYDISYRLKVPANQITGDIKISCDDFVQIERINVIRSGAYPDNIVTCSIPFIEEATTKQIELPLVASSEYEEDLKVIVTHVGIFDEDYQEIKIFERVENASQLTRPYQWTLESNADGYKVIISAGSIPTQLGGYLSINAFAAPTYIQQPIESPICDLYSYDTGSKTINMQHVMPSEFYTYDESSTDYWDTSITLDMTPYGINYGARFDGFEKIWIGGSTEFEINKSNYDCDISANGHRMTVQFDATAIEQIYDFYDERTTLLFEPKLAFASDIRFEYKDEFSVLDLDDDEVSYSGSFVSESHPISASQGYILQRELLVASESASEMNLICNIIGETAETYKIKEVVNVVTPLEGLKLLNTETSWTLQMDVKDTEPNLYFYLLNHPEFVLDISINLVHKG